MPKEFKSLSDERKNIVPYAELDEVRWNSLMKQIEEQDKEFIKRIEEWGLKCALWGNGWIDDTSIVREEWRTMNPDNPKNELYKLAGPKLITK